MVGTGSDRKNEEITRDDFGLHAMIVVVTSTGKVKVAGIIVTDRIRLYIKQNIYIYCNFYNF